MAPTYLAVAFKDKDSAKALGARWDAEQRQWYVPEGRDLGPFAPWLPAPTPATTTWTQPELLPLRAEENAALAYRPALTLSQLLAGVAQAVAQTFTVGVWTLLELVDLRLRGGHVYLEVAERDASGRVLAKTTAILWADHASRILPEFERASGVTLGPGLKLLVRARPVFKPQYGFSLEIDAIDPQFTLGELAARKRAIRQRLEQEGVFDANRALPAPWDFNALLVLAPEGAAGLGDFQAEANRLQRFGLCRFVYVFSRFQGQDAAAEMAAALHHALARWRSTEPTPPDAVVIIRGGGAAGDLAWLDDYALAHCICTLGLPVLTGIGHERDQSLLDEVAQQRFDTPSKVIAGIEQRIGQRAAEARAHFEQIAHTAARSTQCLRLALAQTDATLKSAAHRQLALARQGSSERLLGLRVGVAQTVQAAAQTSRALLTQLQTGAEQALRSARTDSRQQLTALLAQGTTDARQSGLSLERTVADTAQAARQSLSQAAARAQALLREIAGQGPQATLARGFAIVHAADGQTLSRAGAASPGSPVQIEFSDGRIAARIADPATITPCEPPP